MKGHIQQRGKNSFRLKLDDGADPGTGKRRIRYVTVRGTKREAQRQLAKLITAVADNAFSKPVKVSVADFLRERVQLWEAAGDITARTSQRYMQLVEFQILPHLGALSLQALRPTDVERWLVEVREGGRRNGKGALANRTVGHAYRVLAAALDDAVRAEIVVRNVARVFSPPRVQQTEIVVLQDVPAFLNAIAGHRLEAFTLVGLLGGLRLGEALALRWRDIELDPKPVLHVRGAVEHTKAKGFVFKTPKTKAGVRSLVMPTILVDVLRGHRLQQQELNLALGLGRLEDDALLFQTAQGTPILPGAMSKIWAAFAKAHGIPDVTYHGLRHTHASQLIAIGVDIVTIAKRLGHGKPSVTLATYAHMFKSDDTAAADAINAALANSR